MVKIQHFQNMSNLMESRMQLHGDKCLPADPTPYLTLGVGQKVTVQLFWNMAMLHIKLKRMTHAAT